MVNIQYTYHTLTHYSYTRKYYIHLHFGITQPLVFSLWHLYDKKAMSSVATPIKIIKENIHVKSIFMKKLFIHVNFLSATMWACIFITQKCVSNSNSKLIYMIILFSHGYQVNSLDHSHFCTPTLIPTSMPPWTSHNIFIEVLFCIHPSKIRPIHQIPNQ